MELEAASELISGAWVVGIGQPRRHRRGVRRARNGALRRLGRAASRVVRSIPVGTRARRFLSERAWAHLPPDALDAYLVSGYQNPRINIQSILVRHFLIRRLFGHDFDELMDEEIRFALKLNETLRLRALELDVTMGSFTDAAKRAGVRRVDEAIEGRDGEFVGRWDSALADRQAASISVLEFACGSANDYRVFAESGLAASSTIEASTDHQEHRQRPSEVPGADFEVGDITSLRYPDDSFDYVIASDLFEHLSPDG